MVEYNTYARIVNLLVEYQEILLMSDNRSANATRLDNFGRKKGGFFAYCAYAEHKDLKAEEKAALDCSVGSEGKTEIKKGALVAGDAISFSKEIKIGELAEVGGHISANKKVEIKKEACAGHWALRRAVHPPTFNEVG